MNDKTEQKNPNRRKRDCKFKQQGRARWKCITAAGYLSPSSSYCRQSTKEDRDCNMERAYNKSAREASHLKLDVQLNEIDAIDQLEDQYDGFVSSWTTSAQATLPKVYVKPKQ